MDTEGCLCEGDTDTCVITSKCVKCYITKKITVVEEGCKCTYPSFIKNAICGNCNQVNIKYVRAARVAAGEVIAQHFLNEYEKPDSLHEFHQGDYEWRWEKPLMTKRRGRNWKSCEECENTPLEKRLRRRLGVTPPTFRKCLEEVVLKGLIVGPSENPDEEIARKTAEKYMHMWMEDEIQMVESRKRVRGRRSTEAEKNWFSYLSYPYSTLIK
jgi:hypothetical protein